MNRTEFDEYIKDIMPLILAYRFVEINIINFEIKKIQYEFNIKHSTIGPSALDMLNQEVEKGNIILIKRHLGHTVRLAGQAREFFKFLEL